MSFAHTTELIRRQTKTVTRRTGWTFLKPGDVVQPVVQAQGLKKGQRVERIGSPIQIVSVRREPLDLLLSDEDYGVDEMKREGFGEHPELRLPSRFVDFFCETHHCRSNAVVTRIEFEYTQPAA